MSEDKQDVFSESCVTLDQLTKNVENKLPIDKKEKVDYHLSQCHFCKEANDSLLTHPVTLNLFRQMVNEINERIDSDTGNIEKEPPAEIKTYQYIIGGIALVLIIIVLIILGTQK